MKQKEQRNTGNQTRGSVGSEEKDWIRTQCQEIETFLNKNNSNSCHSFLWNYLTLKAPITTAADDIYIYFFIDFQRK